jgi:hypothetical protein
MSQKDYIVINNFENNIVNEQVSVLAEDPLLLSKKLHQLFLRYLILGQKNRLIIPKQKFLRRIKGQNLMNEKEIDYINLIKSEHFTKDYVSLTDQLRKVNLEKLVNSDNKEQNDINLLSFFISNFLLFFFRQKNI